MPYSLKALLLPEEDRRLPGERHWRVLLRTVHLGAVAVLLGGHYFDMPEEKLIGPLIWTVASGGLFVALESYGSFEWLFQVRGVATVLKILLILAVPFFWEQRVWILMVVLVIGSTSSHMSGKYRYYSLLRKSEGEQKYG
ncbi:MAG: hypothetical protein QF473_11460 [Planctomycetota bacterium]|jgi:hypothetical protein|nr:hypothetical protein [Planctomycetota bacterium]MDP6505454.1 hypothetical protein [Planctomycetota bacterium]